MSTLLFGECEYARRKLVEKGLHLDNWDQPIRAGRDMNDSTIGAKLVIDDRLTTRLVAREDVHLHAGSGQRLAKIAHVDIHAARLLAAKPGQRAGVIADHRHATECPVGCILVLVSSYFSPAYLPMGDVWPPVRHYHTLSETVDRKQDRMWWPGFVGRSYLDRSAILRKQDR